MANNTSNNETTNLIEEAREYEEMKSHWPQVDENSAPTAIDATIRTRDEVEQEFKDNLGFDPSDLDAMSQKLTNPDDDTLVADHLKNLLELQRDMGEMLINRFQNNMEAFRQLMPSIYEQFKNYRPKETLEFICTSNGIPNLFFPERNEFFYKVFDPVALCNSQVDIVLERSPLKQINYGVDNEQFGQIHHRYLNDIVRFNRKYVPNNQNLLLSGSCPICIVAGCGLGYHLGHLYERIDIGNLVLIEPNLDLFFASLHAFDWANLLNYLASNNRGIYIMVGQTKDEVFEDLNEYYSRHGRMLACCMWSMVHYRSKEINEIADRLIEDYDRSYATLGFFDDHMFSVAHGLNHLNNGMHFIKRDYEIPKKWSEDTPFVIVANGPSISHDLPFLRKIQDKVIMVACGTALETLYNAGIKPTFYGATERLKVVAEHISIIPDTDYVRDCILLTGDVVHPDVLTHFDHQAIFGKADETFFWLAATKIPEKWREIQPISLMNPLVGNLGVAAASQLGFKNVYLFGVDNGTKRADNKTHPDENIFYNDENSARREQQVQQKDTNGEVTEYCTDLKYILEGNFGGEVRSSYVYRLSANYMDVVIRKNAEDEKGAKFYNCSDGAKLKNAIPKHSEELLDDWLKLPDFDRDGFVKFVNDDLTMQISLTEEERAKLIDVETFDYICNVFVKLLTNEERPKTRIDYLFMLQGVCETFGNIRESRDYFTVDLLDGSLYGMFAMILRTLYQIEDEKTAIAYADQQLQYIIYFLQDAQRLYRFLPDYCAENHHAHLNGVVGYDHGTCKAPSFKPRLPFVTEEDIKNYPTQKFVKRYE